MQVLLNVHLLIKRNNAFLNLLQVLDILPASAHGAAIIESLILDNENNIQYRFGVHEMDFHYHSEGNASITAYLENLNKVF